MDESLSEFQEAKQSCKGPKTVQKQSKIKSKKATKHIKGQKDIRTALRGKKNELISYSKEFDNVCKEAGVDVDSEQLQLAIALSKSLQTDPGTIEKSQPLTSQERVGKIRITLQEYGFKVPEIKIKTNKRIKKPRRQYKLLLTTEAEKCQVISERYSKILFENLDSQSHHGSEINLNSEAPLLHISMNALYESMRDDNIFYANNLVEKTARIGSLLKDWSNIPGRPISPDLFERNNMDFNKIDCSQNELDVILSSSIKTAQSIINSKEIKNITHDGDLSVVIIDDSVSTDICDDDSKKSSQIQFKNDSIYIKTPTPESKETVTQYIRCPSPDIFDDEVSYIMDTTINTSTQSLEHKTKIFTKDIMELTKCVNTSQTNCKPPLSQNETKRKSNDFMEITECIVTSFETIPENHNNIVLTQSSDMQETGIDSDRSVLKQIDMENAPNSTDIESVDLTQPLDNVDLTEIPKQDTVVNAVVDEKTDSQCLKHNIDLTQSSNDEDKKAPQLDNNEVCDQDIDTMDLTQSTNSSDDLPFVQLSNKLEETIILEKNAYLDLGRVQYSTVPDVVETLDLTQEVNSKPIIEIDSSRSKEMPSKLCDTTFIQEFLHEHSDSTDKESNESYEQINLNRKDESDIDLTQDSDSSTKNNSSHSNTVTLRQSKNNVGKENDISTDYDEMCNNLNSNNDMNSSQNTEFEISDKELDYSIHKSRNDIPYNFDFGGISILDNVSGVNCADINEVSVITKTSNPTTSDSFLPEVIANNKEPSQNTTCVISPNKSNCAVAPIFTPNNGDYMIKTNEVTPMMDFASMTTPQRNRELDKYGLKPFKRKRAIQLLTHLYNQTHPIVESCSSEEQPSPSKKQKKEDLMSTENILKSPSNSTTPRQENSPMKNSSAESARTDVGAYEVTSEVPSVWSIECNPEEWVFQKREKAKVHSCRVPLHIAFYNYVASRRELREAILQYEPVNIDIIHKELAGYGHRYDPKDLLKFLDKKCITVKTTDNNSRNNKR